MQEICWGMIGVGDVTERKSGPAFSQVPRSRLVAVLGRSEEKTRGYAERHGISRWYVDAEAFFADPEINAVYIATPPDTHAAYTLRAARAGIPVYVEKPMARTYAECQAMIAACQEAGVPLFVAYYRRTLPVFLKVKELVESGAVGEVRFVTVHVYSPPHQGDHHPDHLPWRVRPEIAGGGYFYDLASHQLDYLDYLFGPITSTAALSANQAGLYQAEDIVTASWEHSSGVLGSGVWCFTAAENQQVDRAEIIGSHGRITFSFFEQKPVELQTESGLLTFNYPRTDPIQQPLIEKVVGALLGQGQSPSTGESAARTNLVMENIIHSSGRSSVFGQGN